MIHVQATVRDYNSTADTATVELVGAGIIDHWYDGLKIDASLNRAYLVHGATVTVATPDPHALCQATIIGINSNPTKYTQNNAGTQRRFQFGSSRLQADGTGAGSLNVTFPIAFSSTTNLNVSAAADDGQTLTVGGITTTGFTVTVTGAAANAYVHFSWHAEGNK